LPRRDWEPEDEVVGRAYDRRLMGRVWRFAQPHRRLILASLALFPPVAALELLQPWLVKVAIDEHILRGDWAGLGPLAAIFLGCLVALYVLRGLQSYLMQLTGQRVMRDLRAAMFGHLQRLEPAFFDRNPVGRLMTRVLSDVEAINELFVSGVVAVAGDAAVLVGVVVIMLGLNWRLALVTFAVVPLLVLVAGTLRVQARRSYRQVRARLARLNAFLQEALQGMSVVQLYARERHEAARFAERNGALRAAQIRSTLFEASLYASVETIGAVAVALLLWYGGGQVVAGTLTFGALVAFLEYTQRFFLPIRDLGAKYTVMQAAVVAAERIFGLLDAPVGIASPPAPVAAPLAARATGASAPAADAPLAARTTGASAPAADAPLAARATGAPAVELRDVWFAYEDERWILQDCSLTLDQGERVALVGATGEGKSTIARLLIRAYDAQRGQVLVGGVDVREWELGALRRHVGLVPQEVFLFAGTVRENLVLGADGRVSADALARALRDARAADLVAALPAGLDTDLRERGANLSQGERQLLALARALIYNPRVLALDEATSSVDGASEARIAVAMEALLRDRASLVIAHRPSTIQRADRILVLHGGRIREGGRHAELLAAGGLYARLAELDAGRAPRAAS